MATALAKGRMSKSRSQVEHPAMPARFQPEATLPIDSSSAAYPQPGVIEYARLDSYLLRNSPQVLPLSRRPGRTRTGRHRSGWSGCGAGTP